MKEEEEEEEEKRKGEGEEEEEEEGSMRAQLCKEDRRRIQILSQQLRRRPR